MTKVEEAPKEQTSESVAEEIRAWLGENWDPELTVAEWWELMGLAGWLSLIHI